MNQTVVSFAEIANRNKFIDDFKSLKDRQSISAESKLKTISIPALQMQSKPLKNANICSAAKATNSIGTNPAGQPTIASIPITSGTANIPGNPSGSNAWKWVVGGILVFGIGCLINHQYQKKKKNGHD